MVPVLRARSWEYGVLKIRSAPSIRTCRPISSKTTVCRIIPSSGMVPAWLDTSSADPSVGRFSAPRTSSRNQDWTSGRSRGRKILVVNSGSNPKSSIGVVTVQPAPGEGDHLVDRARPVHPEGVGEGGQSAHRISREFPELRRTDAVQGLAQQRGGLGQQGAQRQGGRHLLRRRLRWGEVGLRLGGRGREPVGAAIAARPVELRGGPVAIRGQTTGGGGRRRPAAPARRPSAAQLDDLRVSHARPPCPGSRPTEASAASTRSVLSAPGAAEAANSSRAARLLYAGAKPASVLNRVVSIPRP